MARSWFTEDHSIFKESLARFLAKEVVPHIDDWEEERMIPREIWHKLGAQGYLCPCLPEEYGGSGVDFSYAVVVGEELSQLIPTPPVLSAIVQFEMEGEE